MKLSKLVYYCVKEAIYLDDKAFTYNAFKEGIYDDSVDYSQNIYNALSPINEAIARLQDLKKIQYVLTECDVINNKVVLNDDVESVLGVGILTNKGYYGIAFTDLGNMIDEELEKHRTIQLYNAPKVKRALTDIDGNITDDANNQGFSQYSDLHNVCVVYFKEIPYFEEEDMQGTDDVELKDYNITDKICNYIMEYAKSKLMEDMQPELAIVHLNRAENYFTNLDDYSNNPFEQRALDRKYKM